MQREIKFKKLPFFGILFRLPTKIIQQMSVVESFKINFKINNKRREIFWKTRDFYSALKLNFIAFCVICKLWYEFNVYSNRKYILIALYLNIKRETLSID